MVGVITAEKIKIITIAHLLNLLNVLEVMTPALERIRLTRGSSNMNPNERSIVEQKLIYFPTEIIGLRYCVS